MRTEPGGGFARVVEVLCDFRASHAVRAVVSGVVSAVRLCGFFGRAVALLALPFGPAVFLAAAFAIYSPLTESRWFVGHFEWRCLSVGLDWQLSSLDVSRFATGVYVCFSQACRARVRRGIVRKPIFYNDLYRCRCGCPAGVPAHI